MFRVKRMGNIVLLVLAIIVVPRVFAQADQPVQIITVQQNRENPSQLQVPAAEKPEIFIPRPNYDAGEVWEGDEVIHTFIIENRGTALLEIAKVNPG